MSDGFDLWEIASLSWREVVICFLFLIMSVYLALLAPQLNPDVLLKEFPPSFYLYLEHPIWCFPSILNTFSLSQFRVFYAFSSFCLLEGDKGNPILSPSASTSLFYLSLCISSHALRTKKTSFPCAPWDICPLFSCLSLLNLLNEHIYFTCTLIAHSQISCNW